MNNPSPIVLAVQQNNVVQQMNMSKEGLKGLSFSDLISQIMAGAYVNVSKDESIELEELVNVDKTQGGTYLINTIAYHNLNSNLDSLSEDNMSMDMNERFSTLLDELQSYIANLQNLSMQDVSKSQDIPEISIKSSNGILNEQIVTEKRDNIIVNILNTLVEMQNILENNLSNTNAFLSNATAENNPNNSNVSTSNAYTQQTGDIQSVEQILDAIEEVKTIIENSSLNSMTKTQKNADGSIVPEQEKIAIPQDKNDMDITNLKEKITEILSKLDNIQEKTLEKSDRNMSRTRIQDKNVEVLNSLDNVQKKTFKEGGKNIKLFEVKPDKNIVINNEIRQNEAETLNKDRVFQINTKDTHASPEASEKNSKALNFQVQESPEKISAMIKNLQSKENISSNTVSNISQTPVIKNMASLQMELTKHFQQIGDKEKSTLTVQLQPKELGKMKIELELRDGIVNGKIFVESETAKQALQQHMQTMKDQIKNQGINLESLEVNISNESFKEFSQQEEQNKYRPRKWDNEGLYEADNTEVVLGNNNSLSVNRLNILA